MTFSQVLIESFVVGIVTALFLLVLSYLIKPNSLIKILLLGFFTGFLIHIILELIGVNKYYCKHGNSCRV
jgi:hypothetical protein